MSKQRLSAEQRQQSNNRPTTVPEFLRSAQPPVSPERAGREAAARIWALVEERRKVASN